MCSCCRSVGRVCLGSIVPTRSHSLRSSQYLLIYFSPPIMPGGLGEGVRGLPSRDLRAAASTHGNTYLNLTWTKTAILHFYIIIFPPSQNDIVAVQGNENKAECFLANTIISWPESHSDLIGMSLCVFACVCFNGNSTWYHWDIRKNRVS